MGSVFSVTHGFSSVCAAALGSVKLLYLNVSCRSGLLGSVEHKEADLCINPRARSIQIDTNV